MVFSVAISVHKKTFRQMFSTFWAFLSTTLDGSYRFALENTFHRILVAIWLISCTILLSAFSGQLRELLIKPLPIYWIDSWHDLYQWKHLKIETFVLTDFAYYVR